MDAVVWFRTAFYAKIPKDAIASDAEGTNSPTQGSSDTEDEQKVAGNTLTLNDDDNSETGYSGPL